MNGTKLFTILGFIFLVGASPKAQVTLPYVSGFDTPTEQAGWTEYKKAATTFSHWGYGPGFSAPTGIAHDYSPSTGITLTDNWFVSPAFSIPDGGKLDSVRYRFSGFSQPVAGDTVGIYFLVGSQDPALATSKLLLFDFRDTEYVTDNVYRVKTDLDLPPTNGNGYIAIRYRNTDCSTKWLTVGFDNIGISGTGHAGINNNAANEETLRVYPNPSQGIFFIHTPQPVDRIEVFTAGGNQLADAAQPKSPNQIDLSQYPKGVYFIRVYAGESLYTKKILVE